MNPDPTKRHPLGRRVSERAWVAATALVSLGLAAGLVVWVLGSRSAADRLWLVTTIAVLLVEVGETWRRLRRRQVGVDVVALLALIGAILLGELLAGAVIGLMVMSGSGLERYAHRRAQRELSTLSSLAPTVAHRVNGGMLTVPVEEVRPGDVLLVRPGDVVPVDGTLDSPSATLDESVLTGEPLPVDRRSGDLLQSGTVNAGGALTMRARSSAADSAYAGVVRLVEAVSAQKAPLVRLADRYALIFVPVVLAVAGAAWIASGSAVRALAVLVVATPCPLVLAAPVAIVAGISRNARSGVIVKDGAALEALATASTVMFDKTGTLTTGRPRVSTVVAAPDADVSEVLRLAASVEQASPHVLASAIVTEAIDRGIRLSQPDEMVERTGAGVSGVVDGRHVVVGSRAHVTGDARPAWARHAERAARREDRSTAFVAVDGEPVAAILLADELRTDTPRAVRALRRAGAERLVMVTGDHAAVAEPIGLALGLDRVYADRSPSEKVDAVRAETARTGTAVMVGDGVNDAPALAAADLGVAMGARGTSAASEAGGVVLLVDRLDRLAVAIRHARRARGIARQSALAGMSMSFAAMGFAAFGLIPPVAGALLQEIIDVAVILNALRVLRRPAWDPRLPAIPERWARQLLEEHTVLQPVLDELRRVAGSIEDMPPRHALESLRGVVGLLQHDLIRHERTDEFAIYPEIAERLPGEDPLAPMSRTHAEIFHLTSMLGRLVADLHDDGPTPADRAEARRILYGLDAILQLHFAEEEELYAALDPRHVTAGSKRNIQPNDSGVRRGHATRSGDHRPLR